MLIDWTTDLSRLLNLAKLIIKIYIQSISRLKISLNIILTFVSYFVNSLDEVYMLSRSYWESFEVGRFYYFKGWKIQLVI